MLKKRKVTIALLLIICLCFCGFVSCGKKSNNDFTWSFSDFTKKSNNEITEGTQHDFRFPPESAFVFSAEIDDIEVSKGKKFVVRCVLENTTDNDFFTEHGIETIRYSYNGKSEVLDAISVLDTFVSKGKITREIELIANESGEVDLVASFSVKPSKFSDEFKTYTYKETISITVI